MTKNTIQQQNSENCHAGHRERLYQTLMACNFEPVQEHLMLEYLLFDIFKRIDTNPLAHRLINKFGNFCNVFEAREEDIAKVDGFGKASARALKNLFRFNNYYSIRKRNIKFKLSNPVEYMKFFKDKLRISKTENLAVVALNDSCEVIAFQIFEGSSVNEIKFDIREIFDVARSNNSYRIVLVHNHPGGSPQPSASDILNTYNLYKQLITLSVEIHDHIIITENSYFSFDKNHLLTSVRTSEGTISLTTHTLVKPQP